MSKFSGYASKTEADYNKHKDEQVVNYMDGISYTTNPLLELEMVAASSIFGEKSYYKNDGVKDKELNTTTSTFIKACDNALSYDFKGNLLGFDFGMARLGTMSDGTIVGKDIEKLLYQLQGKKHCSKSYYRKKEEIREYINYEIKHIPFDKLQLIVVEKLRNMKYKMAQKAKEKAKRGERHLGKNIRSVFYNLSYRQVLQRIQMLSEENRVTFRSVPSYFTSLECSNCGHIEKGNRLSQELFVCQSCGYTDNADENASKVILKRFAMGTYGSHYKQRYLEEYNVKFQ